MIEIRALMESRYSQILKFVNNFFFRVLIIYALEGNCYEKQKYQALGETRNRSSFVGVPL